MARKHNIYNGLVVGLALFIIGVMAIVPMMISAGPRGGKVKYGDITITSDPANSIDTLIEQLSDKGIIDWRSFNIGLDEHIHFSQPNANSVTLNRVTGGKQSFILGQLTATEHVWLINPSGILFGSNARIDVAGLLATTADISNENFLDSNYYFSQNSGRNAKVINRGHINIADNGMIALVAPGVENAGIIEAALSKVVLGSTPAGTAYVLDFYGDNLLQFALPPEFSTNIENAIIQSGKIIAPGSKVLLTANTAKSVVDSAINMSGIIEANSIVDKKGSVVLSGGEEGTVSVTGTITARGEDEGTQGGSVTLLGNRVGLLQNAKIDVSGMSGGGEVLLGVNYIDGVVASAAKATYVGSGVEILADAIKAGKGGNIVVWSDESTRFYGLAQARGGAEYGDGGFVETLGKNWLDIHGARVDLGAYNGQTGRWLLNPYDVIIKKREEGDELPDFENETDEGIWSSGSKNTTIYVEDIINALENANLEINTSPDLDSDLEMDIGNIYLNANLALIGSNGNLLTLQADNDIVIKNGIMITGDFSLKLIAKNDITFGGDIDIKALTAKSTNINLNAANIHTINDQQYIGAIRLGNDVSLKSDSGDISFTKAITGEHKLDVTAKNNITFGDDINVDTLSATSSDILLQATKINTANDQHYTGTVSLGNNNVRLNSEAGSINFLGAIIGNSKNLGVEAKGDVVFASTVQNLDSLRVASEGEIKFATNNITTTKDQSYQGKVVLDDTNDSMAFIGSVIDFLSELVGGERDVTISGNDGVKLNAVSKVDNLTVNGSTNLGADISTKNAQQYHGAVTLDNDVSLYSRDGGISFAKTIDGGHELEVTAENNAIKFGGDIGVNAALDKLTTKGKTIELNTSKINTSGAQTYDGAVTLGNDKVALESTDGSINFGSTIDGDNRSLDVEAKGNVVFADDVQDVASLHVASSKGEIQLATNNITTTSNQSYQGKVVLDNTNDSMAFSGKVISFLSELVGGGRDVTILGNDGVNLNAVSKVNNLTINGPTSLSADISTKNTQQYHGAVTLGNDVKLESTSGDISFTDTITGGHSLGVTAENNTITLGGNIDVNALTAEGTKIELNATEVKTVGNQSYTGKVNLGTDSDTTFTGGGIISFLSQLFGGGQDVTISGGSGVKLDTVSDVKALTLTGDSTKTLSGDIDVGSLTVSGSTTLGANVSTKNAQEYTGAVTLGNDVSLKSASDGISFTDTITGDHSLGITAENNTITFGGNIDVNALTAEGAKIALNATKVKTVGNQSYTGEVTLEAGSATEFTGGGVISFLNRLFGGGHDVTISGDQGVNLDAISDVKALTLTGDSTKTLSGDIDIDSLTIIGPTNLLGVNISTKNAQRYDGAVTLGNDVSLNSNYSNIGFMDTIDGNYKLNITAGGSVIFDGEIGKQAKLASLMVSADRINLWGGIINTIGEQKYIGMVYLGNNMTLTTVGSDITFESDIVSNLEKNRNLILDTRSSASVAGNIFFNGKVGNEEERLGAIYIQDAHNVTAKEIYAKLFVQNVGGGTTTFGLLNVKTDDELREYDLATGIRTGDAIIATNIVNGMVDVDRLFLGVNSATLTGLVAGEDSPLKAARDISLLGPIGPKTHFLNQQDLYWSIRSTLLDPSALESILSALGNYVKRSIQEQSNDWDYMILLNPLECVVVEN